MGDAEHGHEARFADLERRIRQTHDRYRTLIDNVDVGICIAKMKFDDHNRAIDYRIVDGNGAYERHTGLHGSIGKWVSEFAPNLERHWFDTYGHVALTGESVQFENEAVPLGNRWFEVEAHRVGDPADHEIAILFTDITARRAESERQKTIADELSHRMKNFTAIIQAIVSQTLRQARSMEDARQTVGNRLEAFGRAQDVLLESSSDKADVETVVLAALAPYRMGYIEVGGTSHSVTSHQALGLSLAIHELATNATKYGALSVPSGRVVVAWVWDDNQFVFSWVESDGPAVTVPETRGFGSKLIEIIVSGYFNGHGKIDFLPEGVRFTLTSDASGPN